ncbi:YitT family protein [Nocardioides sp. GY 10113]|uniref:YitT family protein n=1 Tax=Nocardioides sp. GY 10113 TaxID=2569761 RepID=UPI001F0E4E11|nr:YitT family protein [Nocardioides sp. GY 10113]
MSTVEIDDAAPLSEQPVDGSSAPPHSLVDDLFAIVTGTLTISFGLLLLRQAEVVTGGTAGLSLLVSYGTAIPFGVLFVVINLPFFALALRRKGWRFTLTSLACVGIVSALAEVHPRFIDLASIDPLYAALLGNLLAGLGLLVLFRHGASVGGFNIVAILAQERLGLRAGYVQMALDAGVVLGALAVSDLRIVAISAVGAVALNLVLALNHRPGRYLGM